MPRYVPPQSYVSESEQVCACGMRRSRSGLGCWGEWITPPAGPRSIEMGAHLVDCPRNLFRKPDTPDTQETPVPAYGPDSPNLLAAEPDAYRLPNGSLVLKGDAFYGPTSAAGPNVPIWFTETPPPVEVPEPKHGFGTLVEISYERDDDNGPYAVVEWLVSTADGLWASSVGHTHTWPEILAWDGLTSLRVLRPGVSQEMAQAAAHRVHEEA